MKASENLTRMRGQSKDCIEQSEKLVPDARIERVGGQPATSLTPAFNPSASSTPISTTTLPSPMRTGVMVEMPAVTSESGEWRSAYWELFGQFDRERRMRRRAEGAMIIASAAAGIMTVLAFSACALVVHGLGN